MLQVALRWRIEKEVIEGKGEKNFFCNNIFCFKQKHHSLSTMGKVMKTLNINQVHVLAKLTSKLDLKTLSAVGNAR